MLKEISKDVPIIIEYPIEKDNILAEVEQVKKALLY